MSRPAAVGRFVAALGVPLLVAACGGGEGADDGGRTASRGGAADSTEAGLRISDRELRSFVRVSERLERLRRERLAEVQEARNGQERQRIRRRFRAERDSLLRMTVLGGVERYHDIRRAVEADGRLRERWRKMRRELRADSGAR